jgi:small neutral amino acid transporter SnatA (MarC family)
MDLSFVSATILLFLVLDPFGNIPLFLAALNSVDPSRRVKVVLRECAIAFAVLLGFVFFGRVILDWMGLSESSLGIAGGVILFLIALRIIFRPPEGIFGEFPGGEPFVVPLAIPSIAGPSALAVVLLLVSRAPERRWEWVLVLTVALGASTVILAAGGWLQRWLGDRGLAAFERLMGLILTALAVEMFLNGLETFIRHLREGQ